MIFVVAFSEKLQYLDSSHSYGESKLLTVRVYFLNMTVPRLEDIRWIESTYSLFVFFVNGASMLLLRTSTDKEDNQIKA